MECPGAREDSPCGQESQALERLVEGALPTGSVFSFIAGRRLGDPPPRVGDRSLGRFVFCPEIAILAPPDLKSQLAARGACHGFGHSAHLIKLSTFP